MSKLEAGNGSFGRISLELGAFLLARNLDGSLECGQGIFKVFILLIIIESILFDFSLM